MTKPTQFGPPRAFGVGIGGDVALPDGQVVTDCCDDPVDRAALLAIQIGVDASSLVLVQSASAAANDVTASVTATFADDPTPGNLVVCVVSVRRNSGDPSTPSGFTLVAGADSRDSGDNGWLRMFYRVVQTGDGPSVSSSTTNYKRMAIAEFAGPGALTDEAHTAANLNTNASSYPVGPVDLAGPGLLVGAVQLSEGPPPLFTDDPDFAVIDEGQCTTFAPTTIVSYRTAPAGSYSYTPTSGISDTWGGIVAAFEAGDTWILGGARITDGDDATYETIVGSNVLRIDLGAPYPISFARMRIATETSGIRDYTLRAANAADFSDAVTVTDLAFTALGSYTAQDVTQSWIPEAAYRFWELTGDDETRRVHSFELYAGVPASGGGGGGTGIHALDGPLHTGDLPADRVSIDDAGGYFIGNDVEAALQELSAGGGGIGGSGGMVPFYIPVGETFTVPIYKQALFSDPIEVDGALVVNGVLIGVD